MYAGVRMRYAVSCLLADIDGDEASGAAAVRLGSALTHGRELVMAVTTDGVCTLRNLQPVQPCTPCTVTLHPGKRVTPAQAPRTRLTTLRPAAPLEASATGTGRLGVVNCWQVQK
jgi:hypothetical protein